MKQKWKENKTIYLLFFILVFSFYGNSLKNKYALDDEYVTVTNTEIKGTQYIPNNTLIKDGFAGIPKIWKSRYAHDEEYSFDYRPVVTTSFAIEYAIFGQNTFVSHFINVFLYFILICLIYDVLLILFKDYSEKLIIAFISSLLFLIHPLHTEVVDSLKCRDELMAFIFSLIALQYVFSFITKASLKTMLLILVFLFLAFFSKLSAVLIMFTIPLFMFFYRKTTIKTVVLFTIGLIFLHHLFQIISDWAPTEESLRTYYRFENPMYIDNFSFIQKIIIGIKTFGFYIQLLIFPYPMRFYYGSDMFDFSLRINSYFITTFVFFTGCIAYYIKKRDRNFLFAVVLFCLLIGPFLNIIEPVAGIIGDRFTFIPSMAFCILITVIIKPFIPNFKFHNFADLFSKPLAYFLPLIIVCFAFTVNRNANWHDKVTLFEHDMPVLTKSAKANSLMANEYFEMLRSTNKKYTDNVLVQKCVKHYSLAIKNDSSIYSAYNNLGVVYYTYLRDIKSAKNYFTLATMHKSNYAQAYENLGNCYKQEKNNNEAIKYYKKALLVNPDKIGPYITFINYFFEVKKYDSALNIIQIAENKFGKTYNIKTLKASCFYLMGNIPKAITEYKDAYTLSPSKELSNYISQQSLKLGDTLSYMKYKNL